MKDDCIEPPVTCETRKTCRGKTVVEWIKDSTGKRIEFDDLVDAYNDLCSRVQISRFGDIVTLRTDEEDPL